MKYNRFTTAIEDVLYDMECPLCSKKVKPSKMRKLTQKDGRYFRACDECVRKERRRR